MIQKVITKTEKTRNKIKKTIDHYEKGQIVKITNHIPHLKNSDYKTPFITFRIEMYIINMDCFKMTKCIKSLYLYFRYSFIVIDYWKGNVSESDINKNA